MKTKEELSALKEEYINMSKRLAELTEEELYEVTAGKGGFRPTVACRDARTCTRIDPSKCTRYVKNMFLCPRINEL